MGLEPLRIPYLRDAGSYLGNVAVDRIVQRGEPPARFEVQFDLLDHLKGLRRQG
jgi:hypothetical protein